jgi:hypothetical protein
VGESWTACQNQTFKTTNQGVPIATLLQTLFKRVGYELFLMKQLIEDHFQ